MKKHVVLLFLYLPVLCLLAGSCVTSAVSSRANAVAATNANMAKFKTYAWFQDQPVGRAAYDENYNASLDLHLRKAIEAELQAKGFTKNTTGNPDVLVAYDVSVSVPESKDLMGNYLDGFH
jgi:hypothetical protein